jgi:hypothetical protein
MINFTTLGVTERKPAEASRACRQERMFFESFDSNMHTTVGGGL